MSTSDTNLRNLLHGSKQFQVYWQQRGYSWEKKQWKALWKSIIGLCGKEKQKLYIGMIITKSKPGTAHGISPYVVLDGQQRLITLTIIYAALRDHIKRIDFFYNGISIDQINFSFLINQYQYNNDRYKILPKSDHDDLEAYKRIIDEEEMLEGNLISNAYIFFLKEIEKSYSNERSTYIIDFYNALSTRLIVTNRNSDDSEDYHSTFQGINSTGLDLSQADLVRNFISSKLPNEEAEFIYQQVWRPFEESFSNSKEMTDFLWYFLRKDGESFTEQQVFAGIEQQFDIPLNEVRSKLQEIVNFSEYYHKLNLQQYEPECELKRRFQRLLTLDFKVCQIFLMNVYDEYVNQIISVEEFETILQYLESYFVRRLICNIPTNSLGQMFNTLFYKVKNTSSCLVEGLYLVLSEFKDTLIWPDNNTFVKNFITCKIYLDKNKNPKRVSLLLRSIEETLTKEIVDPQCVTIEHIMPQTLSEEWQDYLGSEHKHLHNKWLHTIGNLTLTGYNSELSNRPFDEKLVYLHDSNISLNKYFRNITVWDEQEIKRRASELANIALTVWPR